MTVKHFNTGRVYDEMGQRISYRVEGKFLLFRDHSRGIDGEVDLGDIPVTPVCPAEVMWQYDHGRYGWPSLEHQKLIEEMKYELQSAEMVCL